mmetsp:Transcript_18885/g.22437  ORF Transcript_18885/g.22437 Transcript_18885/m.22437 type:complete len:4042 (-) Transcript_18885:161-12286(-)
MANPPQTEVEAAGKAFKMLDEVLVAFCHGKYNAWCQHLSNIFDENGAASRLEKKVLVRFTSSDKPQVATQSAAVQSPTGGGNASTATGNGGSKKGGNAAASGANRGKAPGGKEHDRRQSTEVVQGPKEGELLCNFDSEVLAVFSEVSYWEKFPDFSIPSSVLTLRTQQGKLEALRGKVLDVCRAYNSLKGNLDGRERRLLADELRKLDRMTSVGLNKLIWSQRKGVEKFLLDCGRACRSLQVLVEEVQRGRRILAGRVAKISEFSLLSVDKSQVYTVAAFAASHRAHLDLCEAELKGHHAAIVTTMSSLYEHFKGGTGEVKREWRAMVADLDHDLGNSIRAAVRSGLRSLATVVAGFKEISPVPIFLVEAEVERQDRVGCTPSSTEVAAAVQAAAMGIIQAAMALPRVKPAPKKKTTSLVEQIASPTSPDGGNNLALTSLATTNSQAPSPTPTTAPTVAPTTTTTTTGGGGGGNEKSNDADDWLAQVDGGTFYEEVNLEPETSKLVDRVMRAGHGVGAHLRTNLEYWNKYRHLWAIDRASFIRNYAKAGHSLLDLEKEFDGYKKSMADASGETVSSSVAFLRVDSSRLRAELVQHALEWQRALTTLLNNMAKESLNEILNLFDSLSTQLVQTPKDLDSLSTSLNLLQSVTTPETGELAKAKAKFGHIEDMYLLLAKCEAAAPEEELLALSQLPATTAIFEKTLEDAGKSLGKCKLSMRSGLVDNLDDLEFKVKELRTVSEKTLPYHDADLSPSTALTTINNSKKQCSEIRENFKNLAPGLGVFAIEVPNPEELTKTEKELDLLNQVWRICEDWKIHFDSWKTGIFSSIKVDELETAAGGFTKNLGKLGREIKHWKVWEKAMQRVNEFKATMPLIMDLRNPAMRPRHWDAIREALGDKGKDLNPESEDFTLAEVYRIGLNKLGSLVGDLSASANKELAIEVALQETATRWASIELDIVEYKDVYFKLRSTEELSQVLEDDTVNISTMKSSKFYHSFKTGIDFWEETLSLVSEVLESVLTIQRKWMYLESIFMASEDIRRQLPAESTLFIEVNDAFKLELERMYLDLNACRACKKEGLVEVLGEMDRKLDVIQKCLDDYLETKRMVFPRFYFISDDDLLEILGQSRDPVQIQKHIKKCFEGIQTMQYVAIGAMGNKQPMAVGMNSPDGETATFVNPVKLVGAVEVWLCDIEAAMQLGLQKLLASTIKSFKGKKEKWVKDWQGSLLITTGAVQWTADCTKGLREVGGGEKSALKKVRKHQVGFINRLTDMVRGSLSKVDRKKVVALITMEIHNRDVMDKMIKSKISDPSDFMWMSQLRFIFETNVGSFGMCHVKQTNCQLQYSYEYQGNNGRLVVTPLTDRCVLTLVTAMFLFRGGNPLGPAGTGKTETVKDLGKNLSKYVVVMNCSDGMDYKSVGRIFSGLVQSGAWGCFDEFNRIKIEVISVVAMQVLSIVKALAAGVKSFDFMGQSISCNKNTGLFITMNPGYAGRTDLPDNLKALMRPVAMMTPDLALIAEVMLAAEGFREAKDLAKKTITLYNLMTQQLSKQDHYDYGLRNLKAVLNMAGTLKRADPNLNEEVIMMRALRDMNLPKFIRDDERLFRLLLSDLFPGLDIPVSTYEQLDMALRRDLLRKGLQEHEFLIYKMIQLYDSKLTRHCNMLVGGSLAGKSEAWQTLVSAKTALCKEDNFEGYVPVHPHVINSKSINLAELYGEYDLATFEWCDGILSRLFKTCAESEKPDEKWIVFDGPIDAMWIESMNSVMDDNKILTLINGDRIPLTNSMSLLFEVEDLAVASPATVSRAGMIYMDAAELGWEPYVKSWLARVWPNQPETWTFYDSLFTKIVKPFLAYKELNCREPVPIPDFMAVRGLCGLYEALHTHKNTLLNADGSFVSLSPDHQKNAEKFFLFAVMWSIMAAVDEKGRLQADSWIREQNIGGMPANAKIFDFFVDPTQNCEWCLWDSQVPSWQPTSPTMPFEKMVVPTVDTVRNSHVFRTLINAGRHLLLTGDTGTGKTVAAQFELDNLSKDSHASLTINFSAASKSKTTQDIIEAAMEKASKNKLRPIGGKKLVIFIDDFNMPKKSSFESPFQPPLELLRLWMDYGGWYDREKQTWRYISDAQLLCAMAPPSGGREVISARTQSRFNQIHLNFPADSQVITIFESILTPHLNRFSSNELSSQGAPIAKATLEVYKGVVEKFLPSSEKFHYLFNIRDVAKVIQGVLTASPDHFATISEELQRDMLLKLWSHECLRVFSDRFVVDAMKDHDRFRTLVDGCLKQVFSTDWLSLHGDLPKPELGSVFCSFMEEGNENCPYSQVPDMKVLKNRLEDALEMYNMEPKILQMDLVLFDDAMLHICRIHRVIKQPRGNLLLVGVGGSGRQSLARLSTYIADYKLFMITINKNYRSLEFHDDLKLLYREAGCENKKMTFLFNETQLKEESFLEDMNNILSSGVVPNLFEKDEFGEIYDAVRKDAVNSGCEETPDALFRFFIDRVRANLHLVLCFSPVGESLKIRCRMFPSLVSNTTIDWFHTWPEDALTNVALKFLSEVKLPSEEVRTNVASLFSHFHLSVINASSKMKAELKRHNYVTPTHYLELTQGYKRLLEEKRSELGSASARLENGLAKLKDAKEQVTSLVAVVEEKKITVAAAEAQCQDLLKVIVVEKQAADAQKAQVEADSERIAAEAEQCNAIAADAKADLDVAMPALAKAMSEVDKLDKSAITEIKGFNKPPPAVGVVLEAVMIFMGKKTDWVTAKTEMGQPNFLSNIKQYDKDNVKDTIVLKIKKYVSDPAFSPEAVAKQSKAASALCTWVHAIYIYAGVAKEVEPKKNALKASQKALDSKQKALKIAQTALAEVVAKVADLKERYDTSVNEKNSLRAEAADLSEKLDRADKLINGLAGEYVRWQASIGVFKQSIGDLVGDCQVASAFLSYAGPFDTAYRDVLVKDWLDRVKQKALPFSAKFSFVTLLADPVVVRQWNLQGLPADDFSTENGVIVTRGSRWPLMVDPQGQANKWVRKMEGDQLSVIDLKMKDFLRSVENGISFGLPVLLQDVLEELDPALEPVLSKSIQKIGTREVIKLGDKELDYSKEFRFYITTKLGNPHYTPEVSTKANIVNFSVKQEGLEAQLLGEVVKAEQPMLEEQAAALTVRVSIGKNKLVALEDTILRLLSDSTGSLLDDLDLIKTLQASKVTSDEVTLDLSVAAATQIEIEAACEGYRSAAVRSSLVYFVLYDLSRVDPMYQFSLASYFSLFRQSISESRDPAAPSENVTERCKSINFYHTLAVYKYTCLGLFERHKLLFSLLLCIRILGHDDKINLDELNFVYFAGVGADRNTQKKSPQWLASLVDWDNVSELDKLPTFNGLCDAMISATDEWKDWYMSGKPENTPLPGEWEDKCSELQRMCLLRAVRADRVLFCATKFVEKNMGVQFADPPPFDLPNVYKTSQCRVPLIFILSPGVDPTNQVIMLAKSKGVGFDNVAMGQGQGPVAVNKLDVALTKGSWLLLANCHLMISWLSDLEKLIEDKMIEGSPHPNFRLWISSSPSPKFPIGILQLSIKMTTEPPKGLRANMSKLLNLIGEDTFAKCGQRIKYKKILFALTWFHSVLLERRKFKSLGFNVPYEFNDSDYEICHDIVIVFLDEYPDETPFDAMRYLIAEANYGGRVTDDWDRRLVNAYISSYICPACLNDPKFKLSELNEYVLPGEAVDLDGMKSFVRSLPQNDHPGAFGQHPNADISSQIEDTNDCISTLVSLQPKAAGAGGASVEERMLQQAQLLKGQVPKPFNMRDVKRMMESRSDPDPLKVVLLQEVERYNQLLVFAHSTLSDLVKAMNGLVSITPLLDLIIEAFLNFQVPSKWSFAYPSLKPLGSWTRDLGDRCAQLDGWWQEKVPTVYWLPGLTYPTGFLTALLQTTARKNALAIDSLLWEFPILPPYDPEAKRHPPALTHPPKEGAFAHGMFLEGARWNGDDVGCLSEPLPMELFSSMPVIHFKPVEAQNKKKIGKGIYLCPLYMYPVRTGSRERPSFVATIELRSGLSTPEFWTKRGTAILLSLAF